MDKKEYSDDYLEINSIMSGEDPGRRYVSDNLNVIFNKNNPSKSMANITLSAEDFVESIRDSLYEYEDDRNIILSLFGGYYSYGNFYEFMSWDMASEEWDGGYLLGYFDDNNMELLKEILKYSPTLININDRESIINFLSKNEFNRPIENIISEYQSLYNECHKEQLKIHIKNELSNKLLPKNIVEKVFMTSYYTTVGNLYKIYNQLGVFNYSVVELMGVLLKKELGDIGSYYEDMYNIGCSNFDFEYFNKEVNRELEKILEKIEEEMEDEDFDKELVDKTIKYIQKLKGVNHNGKMWYPIPTMKGYTFTINNVNYAKGIEITIHKNDDDDAYRERRLIKFDDFPTFIENYKLFESKRQKKFYLIK